jgi:threonine/homoserine efflux transporter RhtA
LEIYETSLFDSKIAIGIAIAVYAAALWAWVLESKKIHQNTHGVKDMAT